MRIFNLYIERNTNIGMNKLIVPFLFIACLFVTTGSDNEPKEEILANREEDIPYTEGCPYHVYDLYKDAFVIDNKGNMHYANYKDGDISLDLDFAAIRLDHAIPKESPDFLAFNRIGKMAYYAYVLYPLTDKVEKVRLTRGTLYLKDVISEDLYDEIVTKYESGKTLEYSLVLANIYGYGLQKISFTISKIF
ncbi:hypothetical protein AB9N12_11000 [Bacteroides sp. AN502(2024)]|uniref:hypothetical protein n=1 Tax=Bacteroides sp. AN502(2024) TaxID=3160599 RepID=UPI00351251CD